MATNHEMTDEQRAEEGAGLHYQSNRWVRLAHGGTWDGLWPVIDRSGRLTGSVIDAEEGYLNVDDEAMISIDEARAGGWKIDEGYATEPEPIEVEVATEDETIRICGGLEDFASLEHPQIEEACNAYHAAVCDAIVDDPRAWRLSVGSPRGQRLLHSGWMGARFAYSSGAVGTMAELTENEKLALSAADDAGREAARKVIEAADAVA